jgi:HD-GYP domain-containing protein (c-di-GMP phosphodiesterase class II)
MKKSNSNYVNVDQIQIGMFIELELGWMAHPFPTGSFKVSSQKQIDTIASLGVSRVRHVPEKSDPAASVSVAPSVHAPLATATSALGGPTSAQANYASSLRNQQAGLLQAQQRSLLVCERRFGEALRQYRKTVEQVATQPQMVAQQCSAMVSGYVAEMFEGQSAIRLLTETAGEKSSMHPVNVTVIALLLGKALGLSQVHMLDLGMASFLHDIGKIKLPDRVRWFDGSFTTAEAKAYQEHVWQGVQVGKSMGLSETAVLAIAQHHEMADGSGFPLRTQGEDLILIGQILALVNRYDNLCNPTRASTAHTPHEALALIFSQFKPRFNPTVLGAFIRMMGVYPPGSVVQLADERYAIVVSVNASAPQKPAVVVFDATTPPHGALILELEHAPNVSIRRSIKPSSLPRDAGDYLAPRQRIAYFFERVVDAALPKGAA